MSVTWRRFFRGRIFGFVWWGWRCWRYAHFQYGIWSLGPLTILWGRR